MAAAERSAIIERENEKAFFGHHLEPEKIRSAPLVAHILDLRAAVNIDHYGIFSRGVEIGRLDHFGVKFRAIVGGNIHEFNG